MKRIVIILALFYLFVSCGKPNLFMGGAPVLRPKAPDIIYLEPIFERQLDPEAADITWLGDGKILIGYANSPNKIFTVYDAEKDSILGHPLLRNDDGFLFSLAQFDRGETLDVTMYPLTLVSFNKAALRSLSPPYITDSIRYEKIAPWSGKAVLSAMRFEQDFLVFERHGGRLMLSRLKEGGDVVQTWRLYDVSGPTETTWTSATLFDPQGKRIAFPMSFINKVNFLNLSDGTSFSVTPEGETLLPDLVRVNSESRKGDKRKAWYCGGCADKKYVYTSYKDGVCDNRYFEPDEKSRIRVFSWDGSLVRDYSVKANLHGRCLCVDAEHHLLYGLSGNGILYTYQLDI